jgi:hypothetical protein
LRLLQTYTKKQSKSQNNKTMNTEFASNVYDFTESLFKEFLVEFEGGVVEKCMLEDIMKFHFPDYKPGDKVKGKKKKKDPNAPKRALTGYTYFGKMNKDKINAEIAKADGDTPPKYVAILGKLWSGMSDSDKQKWNKKAAAADAKEKAKEKAEVEVEENAEEGGEE